MKKPRPRQIRWLNKFNCEIEKDEAARANAWLAVRGWVVDVDKVSDSEGPDFHIYYAYELSSTIYQAHYVVGYDSIHWAISYPEHWEWFHQTVKQGQALTVKAESMEKHCA